MQKIVIIDFGMGNLHSVKKKLDFLKVDSVISSDPSVILNATKLILPGVGHFGNAMKNLRELHLIDALNEAVLIKKTPILGICLGMQLMANSSEETHVVSSSADNGGEETQVVSSSADNGGVSRTDNADRVILRNEVEQNCIEGGPENTDNGGEDTSVVSSSADNGGVSRTGNAGLGWFDAEVVKFKFEDTLRFKVPHTGWNTISIEKESSLMHEIPANAEFYFVHSYYFKANDPRDILNFTEYGSPFASAISKDNIYGVQYHPEKSHDVGMRLLENFVLLK